MGLKAEARNGFNDLARYIGNDYIDKTNLPDRYTDLAKKGVEALTTPIHIGKNATDVNKNGERDWTAKSLVIGTNNAYASNGTAVNLKEPDAGRKILKALHADELNSQLVADVRNDVNEAIRKNGNEFIDAKNLPQQKKYLYKKRLEAMTTPIHIGRNATDLNKDGKRDWTARSLVIGSNTAHASNGTAISIGDASAGNDSRAISINGEARSGQGGASASLRGKGAKSASSNKEYYASSEFDGDREITIAANPRKLASAA